MGTVVKRRLAAIMAVDVVGYSRLMETDEVGTMAALKARQAKVLKPLVGKHEGRIVKLMGDGVLVEFASAVNAVACAAEVQESMAAGNAGLAEDRRIVLRIGVNLGDVMVDGSDLYGDGVNVAARLESLAEPGSVYLSRAVFEQIQGKLSFAFDDLGNHTLKNIVGPVRVYRLSGRTAGPSRVAPGRELPAKPSIAVLPFVNMGGDAKQDYFADGITENIITSLSRFRDLFVIASNSSFAYRGKATKIQEVSRELGVRFVLEGSVQRSGDRIRITAQLIDGATGGHLWVEHYDRNTKDLFKVQDEVTETIVGTLGTSYGGRLRKAWRGRTEGADTRSLQAFDQFQRGVELADRFTREDCWAAREFLRKAIELDPNYGRAYAKLAWLHLFDVMYGWSENAGESLAQAREFAALAVRRDDDEAWGHWALGACNLLNGNVDRAIPEYQRAVELNPNDADVLANYGSCLSYAGRATEGLEVEHRAMRLNPHFPEWYLVMLGQIYFDLRRYEDAIGTLERLCATDTSSAFLYLAASQAASGRVDDARKTFGRAMEIDPRATVKQSISLFPYKNSADLEHFLSGLRKAGRPEA